MTDHIVNFNNKVPVRIQRRRIKGWQMPDGAVSVGRPTMWGNLFPVSKGTQTEMRTTKSIWVIGTWGGPGMWFRDTEQEARALSVKAFVEFINQPSKEKFRSLASVALRGKNLACWCRLCPAHAAGKPLGVQCDACDPCHADVLLEIANASLVCDAAVGHGDA